MLEDDIEKVPAKIRAANGLLWAFDSLYVAVNDYVKKMDSGVYRLTDSNGDDQLDRVEKLKTMYAQGDHGVHAPSSKPRSKINLPDYRKQHRARPGKPFTGSPELGGGSSPSPYAGWAGS